MSGSIFSKTAFAGESFEWQEVKRSHLGPRLYKFAKYVKNQEIAEKVSGDMEVEERETDVMCDPKDFENAPVHPYAPLGSDDAYYVKVLKADFFENWKLCCRDDPKPIRFPVETSVPSVTTCYVSLRYLRDLTERSLSWWLPYTQDQNGNSTVVLPVDKNFDLVQRSEECANKGPDFRYGGQDQRGETSPLDKTDKEKLVKLVDKVLNRFRKTQSQNKGEVLPFIVPFRNEKGEMFWGKSQTPDRNVIRERWLGFWKANSDRRSKTSGWRTRYESITLSHPLMVVLLPQATSRFKRKNMDARKTFQRIIDSINRRTAERWQIALAPMLWKSPNHCLLSEDPFRLYQTYIHLDCVDLYMRRLAKDDTRVIDPIRNIPTVEESAFDKAMSAYIKDVNAKAIIDDRDEDEDEPEVIDGDMAENEDLANTVHSNTSEPSLPAPQDKPGPPLNPGADPSSWTSKISQTLTTEKMEQASGKRKTQKSQKLVMGFSASHMADKVLGWKWHPPSQESKRKRNERQMANGLYIAEWLHLCAFSWGGLDDSASGAARLSSSQVRENLVFGTSEANSCMTRYERAWQQLFRDEAIFSKGRAVEQGQPAGLQGQLRVIRNDPTQVFLEDKVLENGKFGWTKMPVPDENHQKLAAKYKFLAYNIRYEIQLKGKSTILNNRDSSKPEETTLISKAMFYPFSRRFYHSAEHQLDNALYYHMFVLAAKNTKWKAPNTWQKVVKDRFKNKPYLFEEVLTREEIEEMENEDVEFKDANDKAKTAAMVRRLKQPERFDEKFRFRPQDAKFGYIPTVRKLDPKTLQPLQKNGAPGLPGSHPKMNVPQDQKEEKTSPSQGTEVKLKKLKDSSVEETNSILEEKEGGGGEKFDDSMSQEAASHDV